MDFTPFFLQGAVLGLTAAGSPGAFQAYLINQSLQGGWRRGALVALGPLLSDPPIVITILFLLDNLPPGFLRWIGLLGGTFALYLAWGLWRGVRRTPVDRSGLSEISSHAAENRGAWGVVGRAALMNLLSPGPYLFWSLVLGPLLLAAWQRSPANGMAFLAGFYAAFIGSMLLLAALFAQAQRFGPRFVRQLAQLSLLILAFFGIYLIWQALNSQIS
jgi:threonine/homoserine/homoserine lactone efflux protein